MRTPIVLSPEISRNIALDHCGKLGLLTLRVAGRDVRVGRGDGEDEASVPADVGHDHILDLVPDVGGLVTHCDLGQTGQVDECNVEYCVMSSLSDVHHKFSFITMRGVHSQVNGQIADSPVAASHSVSFILDFLHNRGEIREFLSLGVKKLSILDRPIDQLENQGTSCDNTRSSRQKVPEIIFVTYIFSSFRS